MHLDARLRAAAELVPQGSRVADIGTDHAYLAAALLEDGRASQVVACDKNAGPCEAARRTVLEHGLEAKASVRQGDGLAPLQEQEADVVCIAGMGGQLIIEILAASPHITAGLRRLVLQPMNAVQGLRRWLYANGWHIADEVLARADGRIYEILAAEPGKQAMPESVLLSIGPVLWQKKPELLREHIGLLLARERRAAAGMEKSESARKGEKYAEHMAAIKELEAKLTW